MSTIAKTSDLINKIIEPAKYKLKIYHIAIFLFIEHCVANLVLAVDKNVKSQEKLKQAIISNDYYQRIEDIVTNGNAYLQSMHKDCLSHSETHILFCEPYIHSGFRPVNKTFSYYIKSLFMKHNETINAWSHYIGALYIISFLFRYDFSDPYSWPIVVAILTSFVNLFTSATAHLMHQKSQYTHMTCFLCDYAGIGFQIFGCSLMINYICSPIWYYKSLEPFILPLVCTLSIISSFLNQLALSVYKRPYPPMKRVLQFLPCLISYIFTNIPLYLHYFHNDTNSSLNYAAHLKSLILFVFGTTCFALDIPQRFYPGKMDFIGQGHHLFHVCVFVVAKIQLEATLADYEMNRDLIANSRLPPTFFFCFISLFILAIYNLFLINLFYKMINLNFNKHGNIKKIK